MPEIVRHEPGTFCWIELGTTDTKAAKTFYGGLFDWTFSDVPMGPDASYTLTHRGGLDVSGLYAYDAEQRKRGVPPHWLVYVAVASADEAAERAKSLGATIPMAPMNVMDVGRMALIQDPQGAVFAVWEPKSHAGSRLVNEIGSYGWVELQTTDDAAARDFYSRLFGWEVKVGPVGGAPYTQWKWGDGYVGGCMKLDPAWGPLPPHWLLYFRVESCNATTADVMGRGGRVVAAPRDIAGIGRIAVFADPQGAVFAVIELRR